MRQPARLTCYLGLTVILTIATVAKSGYSQTDHDPPEIIAVRNGVEGIEEFVKHGGRFTGVKNELRQNAGMLAAKGGPKVIEAFARAGGKFTQDEDCYRSTAAVYAVMGCGNRGLGKYFQSYDECPASIEAFARAGGKFADGTDSFRGRLIARYVVQNPNAIPAFIKAGGHIPNFSGGDERATYALMATAASIKAYRAAGGKFTKPTVANQKTFAIIAVERGGEVLQAYLDAVLEQGGLLDAETKPGDQTPDSVRHPQR